MQRYTFIVLFLVLQTPLFAQIPRVISFQGVLADANGNPLPDGPQTLTFRLYEAESGSTPVWEESQTVNLVQTVFSAYLGTIAPLALPFDRPYWLGVSVGDDQELAPRTPLTSAPYSLSSVDDPAGWTQSGSNIYRMNGNVGIGTSDPSSTLEVVGTTALNGDVGIAGNLRLPTTTADAGTIYSGEHRFLHNFGAQNLFAGVDAGNQTTVGRENAAFGFAALQNNDIGSFNTAVGSNALQSNTTGRDNSASGALALLSNTTGGRNTATGANALRANTIGEDNTATGTWTLANNTAGGSNTASGASALRDNTGGRGNTAHGALALSTNTTGDSNTAIGADALLNSSTGSRNTGLGAGTDVSSDDLANATAIGYGAVVDASNKVRIGNGSVTVIEGQVAFTSVSDRNQKENFQSIDKEVILEKIRGIPVQSWNYVGQDPERFRHYGPTAQDFFAAFGHDGLGTIGTPTTLSSGDVEGILMIALQALERRTVEQREIIERLEVEMAELKARLYEMEKLALAGQLVRPR